jgi:toxin FitB
MYLLDTNVVSEFRKITMGRGNLEVARWAATVRSETLYLSSVTILEIDTGILLLERRDAAAADNIRRWLIDYVLPEFAGRIMPFDVEEARQCAILMARQTRPYRDALIGATAIAAGFTLVTRNVRDFEGMPVNLINPWEVAAE